MKYLEGLNKVIEAIGKLELDQNTQQTAYLGLITVQLATIADELARMNGSVKSNNEAHCASTDEEIVKPYLEKLKEQIVGKSFTEELFDEDAFNSMYSESVSKDTAECESYIEMTIVKMDDVLRLIDNLLSEQELKNEL